MTAKLEWAPNIMSEFKSLSEIMVSGGVSAGVGGEAKASFEYQNGKVRFELGLMATLGAGAKGGTAFEVGVDEAIELFAHLFQCVDWHRIDSVTLQAFQFYLNATFAQFVMVGKVTEYAWNKFKDFNGWLAGERRNPRSLAEIKKQITTTVNDLKKLQNSPPETLGRLIQTIMSTAEEDDFEAILKILKSADSEHRLKWILRNVTEHPGTTEQEKGRSLQEGIKKIVSFGIGLDGYDNYETKVRETLNAKNIK